MELDYLRYYTHKYNNFHNKKWPCGRIPSLLLSSLVLLHD